MRKHVDLVAFFIFIIFTAVMFYLLLFSGVIYYQRHTSYFIIIINFVFALIFFRKRTWLITLGLLFTLISDYFLAFKEPTAIEKCIAMSTFAVAQISYGIYLILRSEGIFKKASIIVRLALSLGALIVPIIVLNATGSYLPEDIYVASATALYGVNLLMNLVFSGINFKKAPLLVFGFLLFVLCDFTVLFYAGDGIYFNLVPGTFLYWVAYQCSINLTWFFYIPSQMLIVLSEIPSILNLFRKEIKE